MNKNKKRKRACPAFIEEKPSFLDLVELLNLADAVRAEIVSLAEEPDTIQRASDLSCAAHALANLVDHTVGC